MPPVFLWPCLIALIVGMVVGCSSQEKTGLLLNRAETSGWVRRLVVTDAFTLFTLSRPVPAQALSYETLTVYIEGDGSAWLSSTRPSPDPTPRYATALSLALADPSKGVVSYLGRPCQYVRGPSCSAVYWTSHRYGDVVINALNQALSELKDNAGARRIELIGWSGGGVLAALLSARRTDVVRLVTVAANLDIDYWTKVRDLTPLAGSLNPADQGNRMNGITQIHVVGSADEVVPPAIARNYLRRIGLDPGKALVVVPGLDHESDWSADWTRRITVLREQTP